MTKPIHVAVVSELYKAGVTEDGEEYIAECYIVVAEYQDGTRYAHRVTFKGAREVSYEDGWSFVDIREEAKAAATKLANRVIMALDVDGVALDLDGCWSKWYSAYGSVAYQREEALGENSRKDL